MESSVPTLWIAVTCLAFTVRTVHLYQNTSHCNPERQYKHDRRCCNKCQPGTYMTARCTSVANTSCNPCGPDEYMSLWNNDTECVRHIVCDPGKALHVLHSGNRTFPRECVCTEGYHLDAQLEICMENRKCPPGFGVQSPVELNKNIICATCNVGYYSNSTSTTDHCKPWTNCTDVGLEEIVAGTNVSDAVCDRRLLPDSTQVIILITLLILASVLIIFCIYFVCCMKQYSTVKETVQEWVHGKCDQLRKSEKKSPYSEPIKSESKDTAYIKISDSPMKEITYPLYSNNKKESEVHQGRMVPIEDEYMDQRRSSDAENGSMFAGMDSLSDLDIGSLGTFPGFSDTSSDRLLSPSQEEGVSIPLYSHHQCGQSAKAIPRKWTEENYSNTDPVDNLCGHCASQHTFHLFSQEERNTDEEPCFQFTNSQYTRSSADSSPTTDIPPPPSGNVTGNNNTTVISTAPVMNIKTDVVVVYYNAGPQDAHTAPENEEGIRRPMQEESQSRCDSFVGNTQSHRYTDIPSCSTSDADSKNAADHIRDPDSPVTLSQEQCDIMFCQNTDSLPVQEEGKPEYYHSEIV
ncbi:tumor necrosis factor receptor superfamily member 11A [Pseudophryne corroboree]|uniref:tumor necrosis factor receptor superfamily member 11A n=1 Tax=Pseudophryne corroboree TaxID=495146 RepID=UPI0030813806